MGKDNKWTDERIINNLQFNEKDKDKLYETLNCLQETFVSYYKFNERDFVKIMNSVVLLCTSHEIYEDKALFEELLDTLEVGVTSQRASSVNFDPLVELFKNEQFSDNMWILTIILGFSYQPKYIDYLKNIETDDSVLQKEIEDAILELEQVKKLTEEK